MSAARNHIMVGDALQQLRRLPDASADMVLTSPPYFRLRDYHIDGQLGLEPHVDQWVENEHRAALTNRERVHAVQQMALEGLTVGQIAKRTATAKTAVEAAAWVAASPAATESVDQLTLEQAAVLADFDTDPDAIYTFKTGSTWPKKESLCPEFSRHSKRTQT